MKTEQLISLLEKMVIPSLEKERDRLIYSDLVKEATNRLKELSTGEQPYRINLATKMYTPIELARLYDKKVSCNLELQAKVKKMEKQIAKLKKECAE